MNLGGAIDPQYYNLNEDIIRLYKKEIRRCVGAESGFKSFERIGAFHLLPESFKAGEELTQTLKIKRNVVNEKYHHQIESMFRQPGVEI